MSTVATPIVSKPIYPGKYKDWDAHDKLYEDGKHRRYELLFAVNRGAFAISKFAIEQEKAKVFFKRPDAASGCAGYDHLYDPNVGRHFCVRHSFEGRCWRLVEVDDRRADKGNL